MTGGLKYYPLFLLTLLVFELSGQNAKKETPSLTIKKAQGEIKLDGNLDEPDWSSAEIAGDFYQHTPLDTGYAITETEVMVTYDDVNLYVGARCFDKIDKDFVVQSLKRDFLYNFNDVFAVFIDPFNDGVNGFAFALSPYGVQMEGLLQNGGGFGITTNWDNRWFSKVKQNPGYWTVEIAIPFKTLRYKEDISEWGINFSRNDLKRNENSAWSPVPNNFNIASLAYTGKLNWDNPPQKAGSNLSIIPSALGRVAEDYQADEGEESTITEADLSLDAKIAITSSLNLDVTFNPDFSQVDVDRQVTNLTRFSLFFPERRNFFIENSDLFANFGFRQIRPFFSRRIGLNSGEIVPIISGARLSGKLNQKWRIGLMNLQTEGKSSLGLKPQNYTVGAFQRQVFGRSFISGILVNRQAFQGSEVQYSDYNRIAGLDFNLLSNTNRWRGKAFWHFAFTPEEKSQAYANATWLLYDTRNFFWEWNHEYVDKNYDAEVGFVPRNKRFNPELEEIVPTTYLRLEPKIGYRFFPNNPLINSHGPTLYVDHYMDENLENTDYLIQPRYRIDFVNTSRINLSYSEIFTRLLFDTDVTFTDNPTLAAGSYEYRNVAADYTTDQRKIFRATVSGEYGSYFVGNRLSYSGELIYRKQPWGIFSLNYTRNEIQFSRDDLSNANLTLIGTKVELSFTKSLFFTTFLQYNTQIDNLNMNSRLQWRFKPMSDLFIVYTDNYNQELAIKNRALVVKLVYWLTV